MFFRSLQLSPTLYERHCLAKVAPKEVPWSALLSGEEPEWFSQAPAVHAVALVADSRLEAVVPILWTTADAALAEKGVQLRHMMNAMLLTLQQKIPWLEGEVRQLNDNFRDLRDTTTNDTRSCLTATGSR